MSSVLFGVCRASSVTTSPGRPMLWRLMVAMRWTLMRRSTHLRIAATARSDEPAPLREDAGRVVNLAGAVEADADGHIVISEEIG